MYNKLFNKQCNNINSNNNKIYSISNNNSSSSNNDTAIDLQQCMPQATVTKIQINILSFDNT